MDGGICSNGELRRFFSCQSRLIRVRGSSQREKPCGFVDRDADLNLKLDKELMEASVTKAKMPEKLQWTFATEENFPVWHWQRNQESCGWLLTNRVGHGAPPRGVQKAKWSSAVA